MICLAIAAANLRSVFLIVACSPQNKTLRCLPALPLLAQLDLCGNQNMTARACCSAAALERAAAARKARHNWRSLCWL